MAILDRLKQPADDLVYGVTDRRSSNLFTRLNDWFIDQTPVKRKEKALLFYSLQRLVASGVEFTRALDILGKRARNPRLGRILRTVAYDMRNGGLSFSRAIAKYPDVFERSLVKMVASGEMTGKIDETLTSISEQVQRNLDLEGKVKAAMLMPAVTILALAGALGFVMVAVVPQFMVLFSQFGAELPTMTKVLVAVSDFLQGFWWLVLALGASGVLLFQNWLKTEVGAYAFDGFLLRFPITKKLIQNIQTTRIAGNLSTLLSSGISLPDALTVLSDIVGNAVVGQQIKHIKQQVLQGEKLSTAFETNPVFDSIVGEVMGIGEETGDVPGVLQRTADQYQKEVDSQLETLTQLIQPVIILVVGVAVVFMALAILGPIFQLQQQFTQL